MENTAIPAEVAAAIVKVMGGVKKLAKEDTNKFQKYDFVSVDKFLEATCPLCAEAGLVILQDEESADISTRETTDDYGKTKSSAWLVVRYGFTLAHSSGASYGPLHRSVMVPANGAQAFGSAQSYALKQFMRAQFQIPTGDTDDADMQRAEPLPHGSAYSPKKQPEAKNTRPIGSGTQFRPQDTPFDEPAKTVERSGFWSLASYDLTKAKSPFPDAFCKAAGDAPNEDALFKLQDDNSGQLSALPENHLKRCKDAIAKRMSFFAQDQIGEAAE